jgi:hypothetical protein
VTTPLFLTVDEIVDLTGHTQAAAQVRFLRNRLGYTFDCDMRGRPKLLRAQVEMRQQVVAQKPEPKGPNLAALVSLTNRAKRT